MVTQLRCYLGGLIIFALGSGAWAQNDGECTFSLDVAPLAGSLNQILSDAGVLNEVADFGLAAPMMTASPVTNGVIAAGEYANKCFFSFADRENPGNPFPSLDTIDDTGDADISINVYLGHTDEYLFLGFEATDEFLDLDVGVDSWTNDSVELFINSDLEPNDFNPDTVGRINNTEGWQLVADAAGDGDTTLNNRTSATGVIINTEDTPPPAEGEAYSAGLANANGWVVEWQFPLATLDTSDDDGATLTPAKTGDVMLFNFSINDNDFEGAAGQDTHGMLWVVEDDPRSPYGGGENVWMVPLMLTEGGAGVPGDVNGDGTADAADIDAVAGAVGSGSTDPKYDLDNNASVTDADRVFLVENLLNTYIGDSNLDGVFTSGDLVAVFTVGEYEDGTADNSGWAEGDWNGDMDFDSSDFVAAFTAGGYELGPRAAVAAVPEPGSLLALTTGVGVALLGYRRRRQS
jgi:hypothetical protein